VVVKGPLKGRREGKLLTKCALAKELEADTTAKTRPRVDATERDGDILRAQVSTTAEPSLQLPVLFRPVQKLN
jgi:hypothetical protein